MKRRDFSKFCLLSAGSLWFDKSVFSPSPKRKIRPMNHPEISQSFFKIRGIYFHDGFTVEPRWQAPLYWAEAEWQREIEWLQACGINAVEFATMLEFNRIPSTEMERKKIAGRLKVLDQAHALGMQFGYILTNTVVSTVPEHEEPSHQLRNRAIELCPQVPGNFEKTIALQEWYMKTYREADFFEEFAADWGGCRCGKCGVADYLRYVRSLADKLADINPRAKMFANTWSISFWGEDPLPLGWKTVFDREIAGSKEVIAAMPALLSNTHLALPCHHLYRQLTFASYGGKEQTPQFPTAKDIAQVLRSGRQVLAWPHFVIDDDPARAPAWGIVHSEVRYIRDLLLRLREVGIDSVMGNLYLPFLQISNTYAYGRLLNSPEEDPLELIHDFARLVAHPADVQKLTEVMVWLENHSYWQEQMPEDGRLPNLPCSLTQETAMKWAAEVRANPEPALPLPIQPEVWLKDLQRSIEWMTWVA